MNEIFTWRYNAQNEGENNIAWRQENMKFECKGRLGSWLQQNTYSINGNFTVLYINIVSSL